MSAVPDTGSAQTSGYQPLPRTTDVSTEAEPMSLINEREIGNWCKRCKEFKLPIFSDENAAGICIGIAAGLAGAWWSGDSTKHRDRAFALIFGIVIFGLLAAIFALKALSQRRAAQTDLAKLASEMDGACKAGLPRAKALEQADGQERFAGRPAPQSAV